MFRSMRRNKQQLSEYFAYANGKIYFHSALTGHKREAIINEQIKALNVIVLEIEHLTGKAARELMGGNSHK